jgi:hypothetical protein
MTAATLAHARAAQWVTAMLQQHPVCGVLPLQRRDLEAAPLVAVVVPLQALRPSSLPTLPVPLPPAPPPPPPGPPPPPPPPPTHTQHTHLSKARYHRQLVQSRATGSAYCTDFSSPVARFSITRWSEVRLDQRPVSSSWLVVISRSTEVLAEDRPTQ